MAARLDADLLAAAVARHLGGAATVDGIERLSGGASRETWAFTAHVGGRAERLVLRRDPGAWAGQTERSTEHQLLLAAATAGVPVPRARFLLTADDGLGQGFVMDRVDGETIPRKLLRDAAYDAVRPTLARRCGEIAAAVHRIDPTAAPGLQHLGAREQVDQMHALLDGFGEPHPAFELALRELARSQPAAPPEPRVVHGDFRNGNLLIGADGVRAVLDWELAHVGDPVEDLGWMCVRSWRFGHDAQVAGGFGTLAELLDGYAAAGGAAVDEAHVRWWVVLGTVKWGLICVAQAFTHLRGVVRSVELAVLGRRVCEMEWDVVRLLDGEW